MTEKLQIYKCEVCGNIVEMLHAGAGEMVCCGQPMKLYQENTVDAAKEKHVPVIEKTAAGIKVTVGSVLAPHGADPLHRVDRGHRRRQGLPEISQPGRGAGGDV